MEKSLPNQAQTLTIPLTLPSNIPLRFNTRGKSGSSIIKAGEEIPSGGSSNIPEGIFMKLVKQEAEFHPIPLTGNQSFHIINTNILTSPRLFFRYLGIIRSRRRKSGRLIRPQPRDSTLEGLGWILEVPPMVLRGWLRSRSADWNGSVRRRTEVGFPARSRLEGLLQRCSEAAPAAPTPG